MFRFIVYSYETGQYTDYVQDNGQGWSNAQRVVEARAPRDAEIWADGQEY